MIARLGHRVHLVLERYFPEQRLFLRTDTQTRFVRLRSGTQLLAVFGGSVVVGWCIIATAMLLMDSVGSGSLREQAARGTALYEERLSALSAERDLRAAEARAAQERFNTALAEISAMQSALLESETRRAELETGIGAVQRTLRAAMSDRDAALDEITQLAARLEMAEGSMESEIADIREVASTVEFLTAALADTAEERDDMVTSAVEMEDAIDRMALDAQLTAERNDRIFEQLEEAVSISIEPINEMFSAAGLSADRIIEEVQRGYSGHGGPLTPMTYSTKGLPPSVNELRANEILERLDRLNIYRIAVDKVPFASPVKGSYRFTSGFGSRRDPKGGGTRMHNGADFAASHGTAIHATADGTITFAGWQSGYGRLIKIEHENGIETRFAHLANIRVEVGQRVSRGDRIGDMGSSGRSTGTHLHYELRVEGKPVNPMTYIKAARDVF